MPSECEDNSHAQRSGQYRYIITHASLTYAAEGGTAIALRASQPSCCTGGSVHLWRMEFVTHLFVQYKDTLWSAGTSRAMNST